MSVAYGVLGFAASAWEQDWTYDESFHLKWSRRLVQERVTERSTWPNWDSKTPVSVPNVLAMETAREAGFRGRSARLAARAPGLLWYLATVAAAGVFARSYFGGAAGLVAVVGTALDPSLVANSAIVGADSPYALATLLVIWAGVRYAADASSWRGIALGAALGFSLATKFTALLLLPGLLLAIVPFVWLGQFRRRLKAALSDLVLAGVAAGVVISAAYLGAGFAEPLGAVEWRSDQFKAFAHAAPDLRLPLPIDFTTGIDRCLNRERKRDWQVWILDEKHPDGVWWYFLVSWLLKTPLALLAAQLVALGTLVRQGLAVRNPVLLALALNCAVAWTYFSFFFRAQIGYRYVLFSVPILAVVVAVASADRLRSRWLSSFGITLALLTVAETAPYLGNELAFTNALVQPKLQGFRYFTNSTLDYGQNDDRVAEWIEEMRAGGRAVHWQPSHLLPGRNIYSVNAVNHQQQNHWLRRHLNPVEHYRHTQLAFDVSASEYQRFLEEERTLRLDAVAAKRCLERADVPVDFQTWTSWPAGADSAPAWFVCADTPEGVDLGHVVESGQMMLGRPDLRVRYWDPLGTSQRAWYRLEPGLHVLGATRTSGAGSRWLVSGGTVRLWLVRAKMLPGGYIGE